jgi:hypothetical protein
MLPCLKIACIYLSFNMFIVLYIYIYSSASRDLLPGPTGGFKTAPPPLSTIPGSATGMIQKGKEK